MLSSHLLVNVLPQSDSLQGSPYRHWLRFPSCAVWIEALVFLACPLPWSSCNPLQELGLLEDSESSSNWLILDFDKEASPDWCLSCHLAPKMWWQRVNPVVTEVTLVQSCFSFVYKPLEGTLKPQPSDGPWSPVVNSKRCVSDLLLLSLRRAVPSQWS